MNTIKTTLLDLVQAVSEHAQTDAEVVATVVALINSDTVRLCGNFSGAHINLRTSEEDTTSSWPILMGAA